MNAQLMQVVSEAFPASRKVYQRGTPARRTARADARDRRCTRPPASPRSPSTILRSLHRPACGIDIERGLRRLRADWIGARGDVEAYPGRGVQLVDNGLAPGAKAAPEFPQRRAPLRPRAGRR